MKDDVGWLQIVMDDPVLLIVHVLQRKRYLLDDATSLFFFKVLVLGQILRQLRTTTVLEHKGNLLIDGDLVDKFDDIGMVHALESVDLPSYVLNEFITVLRAFCRLKTVGLDCDIVGLFEVVALVDLAEAATAQKFQWEVTVRYEWPIRLC